MYNKQIQIYTSYKKTLFILDENPELCMTEQISGNLLPGKLLMMKNDHLQYFFES